MPQLPTDGLLDQRQRPLEHYLELPGERKRACHEPLRDAHDSALREDLERIKIERLGSNTRHRRHRGQGEPFRPLRRRCILYACD